MKTKFFVVALACCVAFAPLAQAQGSKKTGDKKAPAPKSAADQARDDFSKARNEQGGKFDQARFERVVNSGMAFLKQYPTHGSANTVIKELVLWPDYVKMDRKTHAAQRVAYFSHFRYLLLNERYKEDISEDGKAALAALDVALFDAEYREGIHARGALSEVREKIDALAETPKAGRFLADREMSYVEILRVVAGGDKADAQLKKLTEHKEKGVADAAKREANLAELRKDPVSWKITGLDGKQFDFAQNRGKIIALYFWSTTNRDVARRFEELKQLQADLRRRGLEVVTVSYDKAEDRAKLEKFVKENGIKLPVAFDGNGSKNEMGTKLNFTSSPKLAVFDQKGVLAFYDLQPNQLKGAVDRLVEAAKKKT